MRRLSAHQPIYLGGYIGHFAKLAWCDEWVVFDVCPAEDSGFENRNRIKVGAQAQWLTVPVRRSRETPLSELQIANEHGWQRKHWRTIEMAYRKAPYFDRYAPALQALLMRPWDKLRDLDEALFCHLATAFGLSRAMRRASDMGLTGTKSDLVLDMCVKAEAQEYLFGPQGKDYADVPAFEAAGVTPRFQEFEHPRYPQIGGGFLPNMSVLDLLMNVGGEEGRRVIQGTVRE